MIIDINVLKKLNNRFGVAPLSRLPDIKNALKFSHYFIKLPDQYESILTDAEYEWDEEDNAYKYGNQSIYIASNELIIWVFKNTLVRLLSINNIKKWISGNDEYPMGKANAFFIVYGKLTGQDFGTGEEAGDNIPAGETFTDEEEGGVATEPSKEEKSGKDYSPSDIQKILKQSEEEEEENSTLTTGKSSKPSSSILPPTRSKVGNSISYKPGDVARNLLNTLFKIYHYNPEKPHPIRMPADEIIDLHQRALTLHPVDKKIIIDFLKSGVIQPLEEGYITKQQFKSLLEYIIKGTIKEIKKNSSKNKKKTIPRKKDIDEITTTGNVQGYNIPGAFAGNNSSRRKSNIKPSEYTLTSDGREELQRPADRLYESSRFNFKSSKQKLKESREYSAEKLYQMWKEDRDGEYIYVDDNGAAYYVAHGSVKETIASRGTEDEEKFQLINQWFEKNGISLNIWHINERGNVDLMTNKGEILGGFV